MKKITLLVAIFAMCTMSAQISTGLVEFSSTNGGYSGQIDIDDAGVTVTLIGPDTRWFGIGFDSQNMATGDDIISFDSTGLNDRQFLGIAVEPSVDPGQDWTLVTNDISGGIRTIVATRGLAGTDANDFTFDPMATSILIAWARGDDTLDFSYHGGSNRDDGNGVPIGFTLGVFDQELAQKVRMYPNPSVSETTIDFGDFNFQNSEAKIYSVLGQLVSEVPLNQKSSTIDTSSLPSGIYLVTITAGDSSVTKRLIKQ